MAYESVKAILNTGVAAQAASLALSNVKKKKKKFGLIGQGVTNIVGTSLIQSQAQLIGSI